MLQYTSYREWQKIAKVKIFNEIFDEICIIWQTKHGIFGGKIVWSLKIRLNSFGICSTIFYLNVTFITNSTDKYTEKWMYAHSSGLTPPIHIIPDDCGLCTPKELALIAGLDWLWVMPCSVGAHWLGLFMKSKLNTIWFPVDDKSDALLGVSMPSLVADEHESTCCWWWFS